MSLSLLFWILMLLWLVFSCWQKRADLPELGSRGIVFFLLLILGWATFGTPIQG